MSQLDCFTYAGFLKKTLSTFVKTVSTFVKTLGTSVKTVSTFVENTLMAVRRRSVLKVPKIYAGGMADRNSRMEKGLFSLFFPTGC